MPRGGGHHDRSRLPGAAGRRLPLPHRAVQPALPHVCLAGAMVRPAQASRPGTRHTSVGGHCAVGRHRRRRQHRALVRGRRRREHRQGQPPRAGLHRRRQFAHRQRLPAARAGHPVPWRQDRRPGHSAFRLRAGRRRFRLRPRPARRHRRMGQDRPDRRRLDRQRRRNRRQHHGRSRGAGRHRARQRRQARQPDHDRPQRQGGGPHRHGGLRGRRRVHRHRRALHHRRRGHAVGPPGPGRRRPRFGGDGDHVQHRQAGALYGGLSLCGAHPVAAQRRGAGAARTAAAAPEGAGNDEV